MDNNELTVLTLKQKSDFVQTPTVQSLTGRGLISKGGLPGSLQRARGHWQDHAGDARGGTTRKACPADSRRRRVRQLRLDRRPARLPLFTSR